MKLTTTLKLIIQLRLTFLGDSSRAISYNQILTIFLRIVNLVYTYKNDEKLWDIVVETKKIFFEDLIKSRKVKYACDMNSGLINKQHQKNLTLELLKTLGISH